MKRSNEPKLNRHNASLRRRAVGPLAASAVVLCIGACAQPRAEQASRWDYPVSPAPRMATAAPRAVSQRSGAPPAAAPARRSKSSASPTKAVPHRLSFTFDNAPLDEVIEYFRRVTEINFVIDRMAVEQLGGMDALRVTLNLRDVKVRNALHHCLTPLGLAWCVRKEAVFISTPEHVRRLGDRRVVFYNVNDLAFTPGGANTNDSGQRGSK